MKETLAPKPADWDTRDRERLRHRVKRMIEHFNNAQFAECFQMLDPKLRQKGGVNEGQYVESLTRFKNVYGEIATYSTRLSGTWNSIRMNGDRRPFAYADIVWFDSAGRIHFFRERWVKDRGNWYSRVVGLVAYTEDIGAVSDAATATREKM